MRTFGASSGARVDSGHHSSDSLYVRPIRPPKLRRDIPFGNLAEDYLTLQLHFREDIEITDSYSEILPKYRIDIEKKPSYQTKPRVRGRIHESFRVGLEFDDLSEQLFLGAVLSVIGTVWFYRRFAQCNRSVSRGFTDEPRNTSDTSHRWRGM